MGIGKSVCVIIPARNEESVVAQAIEHRSVPWHIIWWMTTVPIGRLQLPRNGRCMVQAGPLPPGWSGKLWAISEGLKARPASPPDYLLFTDADIVHSQDNVANWWRAPKQASSIWSR